MTDAIVTTNTAVASTSTTAVATAAATAGTYVGAGAAYIKHAVVSVCINSGVAATSFGAGVKAGYETTDNTLAARRAAARAAIAARKAG